MFREQVFRHPQGVEAPLSGTALGPQHTFRCVWRCQLFFETSHCVLRLSEEGAREQFFELLQPTEDIVPVSDAAVGGLQQVVDDVLRPWNAHCRRHEAWTRTSDGSRLAVQR